MSNNFWAQFILGPLIAALIGTLVIGSAAAWITRIAQDRRTNHQLRHSLVTQMTEAASSFHFEAQRYRRAANGQSDEGADLPELRKKLAEQYVKTRVMGEVLESRLGAYFRSDHPRQLWHETMDLAAVRYFDLIGVLNDRLRALNAGPYHSGLTEEELNDRTG